MEPEDFTDEERDKYLRWMRRNLPDYIDSCGEVDCTSLAEDCADEFNVFEDDVEYKIPEELFELAFEASESVGK